jgi:Zn finger protein HypA/HybF involved in hydrogenase expression
MHEWGIAQAVIEKIVTAAKENKLTTISEAGIILGKHLGITKEEFLNCLQISAKEKHLENISFNIQEDESHLASIEYVDGN